MLRPYNGILFVYALLLVATTRHCAARSPNIVTDLATVLTPLDAQEQKKSGGV